MSIRTTLRLSRESRLLEGTPDQVDRNRRAAADETLRHARLEAARRCQTWTEIADDLVPRAHGWHVSASSDAIYVEHRGVTFSPGFSTVLADRAPLYFVVEPDSSLRFYERIGDEAHTYTSWLEREAERERARAAKAEQRPAYLDGPGS